MILHDFAFNLVLTWPVVDILPWTKCEFEKNTSILSQGCITGFGMNFAGIYKGSAYFHSPCGNKVNHGSFLFPQGVKYVLTI